MILCFLRSCMERIDSYSRLCGLNKTVSDIKPRINCFDEDLFTHQHDIHHYVLEMSKLTQGKKAKARCDFWLGSASLLLFLS